MKTKNKNMILTSFLLLFSICFLFPTLSVKSKNTEVEIKRTGAHIAVNGSEHLMYFLFHENPAAKYTFTADNTSIISIDSQNVLTGLKTGEANVTVTETIDGTSKTIGLINIVVKDASLSSPKFELAVNELDSIGVPHYENTKATYKITSSNPSIVSTDSKLRMLGKKPGKAYITLTETYQNKSRVVDKSEVIVQNPRLHKTSKTIALNEQIEPIKFDLLYKNKKASYKMYTSNKSIVSVLLNRVGIGKKPGTATLTITETYLKKTRTVATLKVKVAQSVIDKKYNSMEAYIDERKQLYPTFYVKYCNQSAAYSLKSKNTDIVTVDGKNYLTPLKKGTTTIVVTETYLNKSRIVGEVKVTVHIKPELITINSSYVPQEKNQNGDYFITLSEGVNGNLSTLLSVTPKQLELEYVSSNNNILSIDKNTGTFKANAVGETMIQVLGKNSSLKIAVSIIPQDSLLQLCEESKLYTTAIDSLDADSITQDNLMESYDKLTEIYKIIGKEWPGGDWTDDSHLYTLTKEEHFWKIPNIQKMHLYRNTLKDQLLVYVKNKNQERKIVKVNLLDTTTLEVELSLPFTKEEFTYNRLNDTESALLDAIQSYNIYDETGMVLIASGGTNYTSEVNKIEINLLKPLKKGSYIIKIPGFNFEEYSFDFEEYSFDFKLK